MKKGWLGPSVAAAGRGWPVPPLLALFPVFVAGVAVRLGTWPWPPVLAVSGGLLIGVGVPGISRRPLALIALPVFATGLLLGWICLHLSSPQFTVAEWDGKGELNGVFSAVVEEMAVPSISGARTTVSLLSRHTAAGDLEAGGRLLLYVRGMDPLDVVPGSIIRFRATLHPISARRVPGVGDRRLVWWRKGVAFQGEVSDPQLVVVVGASKGRPVQRLRSSLARLFRLHLDKRSAGLALGLIMGEKGWLSPDIRRGFRRLGLSHILAVSGLHMGLVALFFGYLAYRMLLWCPFLLLMVDPRRFGAAVAMVVGLGYAALAGFSPSATRAAVMIGVFSAALLLGERMEGLNALALAGWVLVALRPWAVVEPGFQMSMAAVAGLLLLAGNMPDWARGRVRGAAAVSLVAWASTAPLAAYHFHEVSLVAPLTNLVLVPPICGLIMPLALLAPVTHLFGHGLSHPIFWFLEVCLSSLLKVVDWASGLVHNIHWSRTGALFMALAMWGSLGALLVGRRVWGWRRALMMVSTLGIGGAVAWWILRVALPFSPTLWVPVWPRSSWRATRRRWWMQGPPMAEGSTPGGCVSAPSWPPTGSIPSPA